MKATLDLPDDLYRRVKARSAMEGRPLRNVAIELFQKWLDPSPEHPAATSDAPGNDATPWLAITRRHLRPGMSHDLESIRIAIGKGWSAETVEKISSTEP